MAKKLVNSQVPGEEPTQIVSPSMSLTVARDTPDKLGKKPLGSGKGKIDMPSAKDMFGDGNLRNASFIDSQV